MTHFKFSVSVFAVLCFWRQKMETNAKCMHIWNYAQNDNVNLFICSLARSALFTRFIRDFRPMIQFIFPFCTTTWRNCKLNCIHFHKTQLYAQLKCINLTIYKLKKYICSDHQQLDTGHWTIKWNKPKSQKSIQNMKTKNRAID